MNATVLVTPVDCVEAQCAAIALQGVGVEATASSETEVAAVVEFVLPGNRPQPSEELCPDRVHRPLLLVTPELDEAALQQAVGVGAEGLLRWDCSTASLADAVRRLLRGESELPAPERRTGPRAGLTAREQEIVELLERGASNESIAASLGISYHTARTHVAHVLAKLGVSHRYAAAVRAGDEPRDEEQPGARRGRAAP